MLTVACLAKVIDPNEAISLTIGFFKTKWCNLSLSSDLSEAKNQKTNNELEEDEKKLIEKKKHEREEAEELKREQLAELNKKSEAELEEEAEQKKAQEVAAKKDNAAMYR